MVIYTIGFTKSTAENFFESLKRSRPDIILDVRLNNSSQLAGFAKAEDLSYFLKVICNCAYRHDIMFAPSAELLVNYKHKKITWDEYTVEFEKQMENVKIANYFYNNYGNYNTICFLCSEKMPQKCHRRLLAEMLIKNTQGKIIHL